MVQVGRGRRRKGPGPREKGGTASCSNVNSLPRPDDLEKEIGGGKKEREGEEKGSVCQIPPKKEVQRKSASVFSLFC